MIVERTIILNNREILYEINYKKIKNCYLRVEHGKIKISASKFHSIKVIEDLIKSHQNIVLKQIDSYENKVNYQDNGFVYLFHKKYKLIVRDLKMNKCVIHDDKIYIYSSRIQETLDIFLKEQLYDYIFLKIKEYIKKDFCLSMPDIQIKKMKRRWGACFYTQNKVCFNFHLVYLDYDLIDYVIVHELCHFIEANHSKKFYLEIEKRLPNYRILEKKLKEVSL